MTIREIDGIEAALLSIGSREALDSLSTIKSMRRDWEKSKTPQNWSDLVHAAQGGQFRIQEHKRHE